MNKIIIGIYVLIVLAACSSLQTPTATPTPSLPVSTIVTPSQVTSLADLPGCKPTPYVVPTLPAEIPAYTQLDKSIGLHITGTYTVIDPQTWRLKVDGKVDTPIELTYDQVRCLPAKTQEVTLICPMVFQDVATWTGVPLSTILELAGVQGDATQVDLVSVDGYKVTVSMDVAKAAGSFLAYEVNGQILPILHGFPLRAVFKDQPGNFWNKWLVEITVR